MHLTSAREMPDLAAYQPTFADSLSSALTQSDASICFLLCYITEKVCMLYYHVAKTNTIASFLQYNFIVTHK